MNELLSLLAVLLLASVVNLYFSIQILRRVSAAEIKISFFEIRWQVHKNMKTYCRLTREEQGRIGNDYYGYWLSLLVMLIAGFLLLGRFLQGGITL